MLSRHCCPRWRSFPAYGWPPEDAYAKRCYHLLHPVVDWIYTLLLSAAVEKLNGMESQSPNVLVLWF